MSIDTAPKPPNRLVIAGAGLLARVVTLMIPVVVVLTGWFLLKAGWWIVRIIGFVLED